MSIKGRASRTPEHCGTKRRNVGDDDSPDSLCAASAATASPDEPDPGTRQERVEEAHVCRTVRLDFELVSHCRLKGAEPSDEQLLAGLCQARHRFLVIRTAARATKQLQEDCDSERTNTDFTHNPLRAHHEDLCAMAKRRVTGKLVCLTITSTAARGYTYVQDVHVM